MTKRSTFWKVGKGILQFSGRNSFSKSVLTVLCLMLFALHVNAAQQVSGTVTDETGMGMPGVNVTEKGTTNGAVTDVDGKYSLTVSSANSVLVFSFVGYEGQEVTVGSQSVINVALGPDSGTLEEVVVVGYGTQKKVTVTGAVTAIKGAEIVKSPAVDMSNSLAGRLPGLVVIQTSGEPGYDGASVSIRGTNTLGNSSPLIVIDGIPDRDGGLGRLNPKDIESVSVLKDASAAIYGARAANGAILITTKRGKSGKPTISYDFNQGFAQPGTIPQMSNAYEYMSIMNELPIYKTVPVDEWGAAWESIQATGEYDSPTEGVATINSRYPSDLVERYRTGNSDPWFYPDTDWYDDTFRDWAPQGRHNLQISGGAEKIRYMASMGIVNQQAIYNNSATKYNQYNFRTNLDANINKYINTSLGVLVRREARTFPTVGSGAIFRMLMRGRPNEPAVWPNGLPGPDIENGQNPYTVTTNATGYVDDPTDYTQAQGAINITNPWIDGLKLTLSGAIDKKNRITKTFETPWKLWKWDGETVGADGLPVLEGATRSNFTDPRLRQRYESVLNTNATAMLSYDKSLQGGIHNLNFLAGVTRETFEGENFEAYRRNYISSAIDQLFAGGTEGQQTGGSAYERARLGYYGRAQYNYKEKYLAEFIWRYDGSYIFPEADRFGFFPGVLLGYNISEEDFFNVSGVDFLKLRGSYGQMGNDQVFYNDELQEYAYLSTYGFGQYPINNVVVNTLTETRLANPSFTWERANNLNIGLDAGFFNNKVDLTLEYFLNKRDQILIQKTGSTPASSGISSLLPPVNAGQVENKGFEFALGYNGSTKRDLRFRAGVNGGFAKNKIIFMDEVPGAPDYQRQEGNPIGAPLVYISDGVFRDAAEIDANTLDYSAVTSQLLPGDMKFVDYDGNGIIDGDDAIRYDKNTTPTFNFGATLDLDYKNFDLSVLFQGATGAVIRVQTESGDIGNYLRYDYENRWSIDNPSSTSPRLASRGDTYYTGGNYGNNTYHLYSKNYVRLKNIELGYTLPATLTERVGLGNARLYVNGLNVFTIAAQDVFDPEFNSSSGQYYPQSRVLNTGLSITF
ncbi:SusC/RagA family TonB-linked outer membrane protein [Jiulongibacter sp. NS-SX5]|uniref:SusC/RagA family TonB-linked outer membrane protein n=1 Tax=Jiulongibacter sp. NS-SX5 TaxID=3463854 RepID=UPI004057DB57